MVKYKANAPDLGDSVFVKYGRIGEYPARLVVTTDVKKGKVYVQWVDRGDREWVDEESVTRMDAISTGRRSRRGSSTQQPCFPKVKQEVKRESPISSTSTSKPSKKKKQQEEPKAKKKPRTFCLEDTDDESEATMPRKKAKKMLGKKAGGVTENKETSTKPQNGANSTSGAVKSEEKGSSKPSSATPESEKAILTSNTTTTEEQDQRRLTNPAIAVSKVAPVQKPARIVRKQTPQKGPSRRKKSLQKERAKERPSVIQIDVDQAGSPQSATAGTQPLASVANSVPSSRQPDEPIGQVAMSSEPVGANKALQPFSSTLSSVTGPPAATTQQHPRTQPPSEFSSAVAEKLRSLAKPRSAEGVAKGSNSSEAGNLNESSTAPHWRQESQTKASDQQSTDNISKTTQRTQQTKTAENSPQPQRTSIERSVVVCLSPDTSSDEEEDDCGLEASHRSGKEESSSENTKPSTLSVRKDTLVLDSSASQKAAKPPEKKGPVVPRKTGAGEVVAATQQATSIRPNVPQKVSQTAHTGTTQSRALSSKKNAISEPKEGGKRTSTERTNNASDRSGTKKSTEKECGAATNRLDQGVGNKRKAANSVVAQPGSLPSGKEVCGDRPTAHATGMAALPKAASTNVVVGNDNSRKDTAVEKSNDKQTRGGSAALSAASLNVVGGSDNPRKEATTDKGNDKQTRRGLAASSAASSNVVGGSDDSGKATTNKGNNNQANSAGVVEEATALKHTTAQRHQPKECEEASKKASVAQDQAASIAQVKREGDAGASKVSESRVATPKAKPELINLLDAEEREGCEGEAQASPVQRVSSKQPEPKNKKTDGGQTSTPPLVCETPRPAADGVPAVLPSRDRSNARAGTPAAETPVAKSPPKKRSIEESTGVRDAKATESLKTRRCEQTSSVTQTTGTSISPGERPRATTSDERSSSSKHAEATKRRKDGDTAKGTSTILPSKRQDAPALVAQRKASTHSPSVNASSIPQQQRPSEERTKLPQKPQNAPVPPGNAAGSPKRAIQNEQAPRRVPTHDASTSSISSTNVSPTANRQAAARNQEDTRVQPAAKRRRLTLEESKSESQEEKIYAAVEVFFHQSDMKTTTVGQILDKVEDKLGVLISDKKGEEITEFLKDLAYRRFLAERKV